MNRTFVCALTAALATLAAAPSMAADAAPKTRAEVRAELAQAQRMGEVPAAGTDGLTARQVQPQRYPAQAAESGKTRAQVRAELDQARRNGELSVASELGQTAREVQPQRYPSEATAQSKSRDQVRAEVREAIRKGELNTVSAS